jgi:hypothetical protein
MVEDRNGTLWIATHGLEPPSWFDTPCVDGRRKLFGYATVVVLTSMPGRKIFSGVTLTDRSGFEMLLASESDMAGTKPYPHNSSSKVATVYCNVLAIQCLRTATASPST